jgi:hypothetical protein
MSVTVAITVTIPNFTAAGIVAVAADFHNTIEPEVRRLVMSQVAGRDTADPGNVTSATVVT